MDKMLSMLNKNSGLLGISGLTNDMRELIAEYDENKDRRAKLAIGALLRAGTCYIEAYLCDMNGASAIVFTGELERIQRCVRK